MIETGVQSASVVVDGVRIAYESTGEGDPPVVFAHGIFENRGYFGAQVSHLEARHRVIAIDLRGHGESDLVTASATDFERDMIAVLEAACAGPAVVCGHSVAGGVALLIAARRPDLVRAVVMLDAVIFFPEAARQGAITGLVPALHGDQWREALIGYLGGLIDPAPPEVKARVLADLTHARRELAISFFEGLYGTDFGSRADRYAEALQTITCPLLYVRGKAPADLERLVSLKPDAMVGQVIGSGHYVMLSAADQVNAMLDQFLATVGQRP